MHSIYTSTELNQESEESYSELQMHSPATQTASVDGDEVLIKLSHLELSVMLCLVFAPFLRVSTY